jgi:hypothetical protein
MPWIVNAIKTQCGQENLGQGQCTIDVSIPHVSGMTRTGHGRVSSVLSEVRRGKWMAILPASANGRRHRNGTGVGSIQSQVVTRHVLAS